MDQYTVRKSAECPAKKIGEPRAKEKKCKDINQVLYGSMYQHVYYTTTAREQHQCTNTTTHQMALVAIEH